MATPLPLTLDPQQVLDAVRALMAQLELGPADVDPAARLVDDLELDSLDRIDLVLRLEEHFDVELREEPLASVHTVQDVADGVLAVLGAQGRARR